MVRYVILLFTLPLVSIAAVRYPVSPAEPKVAGNESPVGKKKSPQTQNIPVHVSLKLGSGDEIQGTIAMPENITFSHQKNGLTYSKTIRPTQLKKIRINEYRSRRGSGNFWEFEPETTTLITQDDRDFTITGIFPFLRKIVIDTPDGTTTVFTFFADSWDDKTGWSEVASKDRHYHRKNPHPQAVKEITILGTPSAAGDKTEED